ncbi:MAG: 5,10-methylenetetrahydrofolate reductase [Ilumatobacteraceae bacterium]
MDTTNAQTHAAPAASRQPTTTRSLIADARYEVIPLKNLEGQLEHIPVGSSVSVTCSAAKGQQVTLDLTRRILALGYMAVPHFSARLTEDDQKVRELAAFCRDNGIREMFLVGGDPEVPAGKYDGAVAFLRDFLGCDHGLQRIGITSYPDGHALIPTEVVHEVLHAKQALLKEAGVPGFASTQMHFDVPAWKKWAAAERAAGFELPLHIGVPGVIDRAKLFTMGMRLGIGSSMRYVQKNRGVLGKFLKPGGYDPMKLLTPLGKVADELNIEGVHLFTFNNIKDTADWQRKMLAKLS